MNARFQPAAAPQPVARRGPSMPAVLIAFVLCALIGWALRLPHGPAIRNYDEVIPLRVHAGMDQRQDLNTDWRLATAPIDQQFGAFRYNFSAYILGSYLLTPSGQEEQVHLHHMRSLNRCLFVAQLLVLWGCCVLLGLGAGPTAAALAVLTLAPGLVHDAQMARPETFMTLLVGLAVLGLVGSRRAPWPGLLLAALASGVAIACKFTLLVLGLPLLVAVCSVAPLGWRTLARAAAVAGLVLLGFVLAAPYAARDPSGLMDGLRALNAQYSGGHLPHSSPEHATSFAAQSVFFLLVYGLACVAPLTLPFWAPRRRAACLPHRATLGALSALYLVFFGGLAAHAVFFERNFHPMVPLMALSSAVLVQRVPAPRWRALAAGVLLLPLLYWSAVINRVQTSAYSQDSAARLTAAAARLPLAPTFQIGLDSAVEPCGTGWQSDYGDPTSASQRARYLAQDYRLVVSQPSPFQRLPTSTLQTYLAPGTNVLHKDCPWPFHAYASAAPGAVVGQAAPLARASAVLPQADWRGSDYYRSVLPGLLVIGSYQHGDSDTGRLVMRLRRGERLWYRAGPGRRQKIMIEGWPGDSVELPHRPEWVQLVFDGATLPEQFVVTFDDPSAAWGEWSAVAIENDRKEIVHE